jgi:diguanylate cyclase (GGDEF)-like protein/PAS domain S-box-containing protein
MRLLPQANGLDAKLTKEKLMANRVLIITGVAADANLLKDVLGKAKDGPYAIEWLTRLGDALKRVSAGDIDVILVDLALPDSQGIETFDKLFAAAPEIPVLTLSAEEDETLAVQAVERGSQGYLSKGHFGSYLVPQSLRNIIQRKAVEAKLHVANARAEITLDSISDAVIGTDLSGNVDYFNLAAERMTGWPKDKATGQPIGKVMKLINGVTRELQTHPIELVLQQNKAMGLKAGTILVRGDGSEVAIEDSTAPIYDAKEKISGAVMVFHDVSAAQAMTMKMAHLAQHDFLTNLPNRVLLNDRIAQAIVLAERRGTTLAVLFLDLDNFKHINDSLGHEIGDKLLQSVAQRLATCVRGSDTVSRQGGDEFVVVVTEDKYVENATLTADKILSALAVSHFVAGHELHVTTSIGISVYPADAKDAETLIKNADTAMYQAKEKGRNNYQFFKSGMNVRAVERQVIETHLRQALARQEFVLHYQPKINLVSGAITGAEALLRWIHPDWGTVLPERFVPVAEDCGLIVPIGRWVLREACTQAKAWQDAGLKPTSIAVNISAVEFRHKDFVKEVRAILSETGLAPRNLQLEITESVLMRDAPASTAILQQLKTMGVQLAVDDFGTGYSSLSYLKQFPIDVLKIDQSFVQDIGSTHYSDGVIVSAVIAMGTSLKQRVVAEGVEEEVQLAFLKQQNCEEGQGYIFSRPLEAEQFATLLATGIDAQANN